MSEFSVPSRAEVVIPVDPVTAARAEAAGYTVRYFPRRIAPEVTLICRPTDALAVRAADHVAPHLAGDVIRLDLSEGALRLIDESPPIPSEIPGPDSTPLWAKPEFRHRRRDVVHLPASSEVAELPQAAIDWLTDGGSGSGSGLQELEDRWEKRKRQMLEYATSVVQSLPDAVSVEERHGVLNKLNELATQVRHACDGGLDPEDTDMWQDWEGDPYPKPAHAYVNEAYRDVLKACDRVVNAGGDRERSGDVHSELSTIVRHFEDQLPERFIKAKSAGMLDSMIGAARNELLEVVWPGWRYPSSKEKLQDAVNPDLAVLDRLIEEREVDRQTRNWSHESIGLRWLNSSQVPALVSSFLGRTILREIESDPESGRS